jgi:SAM-dependent methyltransferase
MPESTYIHGTAPGEQARLAALNALTNPAFIQFLALEGHEQVLEIGSGLGILAAEVAARVPHGSVLGVELAQEQLDRTPKDIRNLSFVRADAHSLPFPDAMFDVVYCRYLLEHVADPVGVLREAHRVLRTGGRLHLQENDITLVRHDPATPAFYKVWTAFARLQAQLGGDATIGRKLYRLAREAGFSGDVWLSVQPEVYWQGHGGYRPWLENLAGNLRSGERALQESSLCSAEDLQSAFAELQAAADAFHGSTWFVWNRASATK